MLNFLKQKYSTLILDEGEQAGKPLSLRRNFSWNFAGNIVYAACQWGMLVVLAKLTSPEKVGLFALGLAVTAPIFLFSQLQLRGVQATDARDEYQFGHYLGLRLITTVLALAILCGVIGFSNYDRTTGLIILAVALSKAFESVADVFYGLLQRHERMDRIARSRMIKGPLALCMLGGLVYTTGSVTAGVCGLAAAWGAVLVSYDLPNVGKTLRETSQTAGATDTRCVVRPTFTLRPLLQLAWLALPLGLTLALLSLKTNIPRYFIEHYLGAEELGYFAALSYLMIATGTIVSAMGQTCVPRLARYYAERQFAAFKKLLWKLIGIGGIVGSIGFIGAVLFGQWLLSFVYSPDYASYSTIFSWLMLVNVIAIVVSFLGYAVTSARRFKIQLPFAIVTCLVTLIVSYVFIPRGLMGGVLTLLIGNVVLLILYSITIVHAMQTTAHRNP